MTQRKRAPQNGAKKKVNKPPVLFKETQELITRIADIFQAPFLTYWNSANGSICDNDVVGFYEVLQHLGPSRTIYLFVKSHGGHGESSLRIVNLLRQYAKRIVVVAPLECASAATMLALGADEIQMGPLAHLTPVDTSLTHDLSPIDRDNNRVRVSLDELQRVVKLGASETKTASGDNPYKEIYPYIHPLVLGAVDRLSSLSIQLCDTILSFHVKDPKKRRKISETLNSDYPSHSYPITYVEAKKIGLPVSEIGGELNDLLLDLNQLYSRMGKKAYTDYDEHNYHDNEIPNILEGVGLQIFYQNDKDWHYRQEERRWVALNDDSSWHKVWREKGRIREERFEIR